jgi:F0F1-type ATP synthase delta subunit
MVVDKSIRDFVKKLLDYSIENGEVSAAKVKEVVKELTANPPRKIKAILTVYKKYIAREIAQHTATIEHGGPINQQAIDSVKAHLEKVAQRSIQVKTIENPDLLAGIRVTLGDDVFEDSAAFRLRPLAESNQ